MWKSRAGQVLRSAHMLSLQEPFFAQHNRSMAAISAMQPHMRQSMVDISQRMHSVDLVVEMRDARIPHTSANYSLINLIRGKPRRLLLLNKADIAHKRFRKETLRELSSSNQQVLYTCTSARGFAAEVLDAMRRCLFASDGDLNKTASKTNAASSSNVHVIMVVGTPNVGKTSLINALRQHARKEGLLDVPRAGQLPVGALPGVTKHVSGIKLSDNPTMLLVDTPGIMLPRLTASSFAYRVALAGLVQETQVQLENLFAFTLYVLAQPPNRSQLKAVLAEPIPSLDGSDSQGGRREVGAQAAVRWSYASKRVAKCTLQAIDEVLAAYKLQASAENDIGPEQLAEDESDVWKSVGEGISDVNRPAGHVGVSTGTSAGIQQSGSGERGRPQRASEYLALINPGGETSVHVAPPVRPHIQRHSPNHWDSESAAQRSDVVHVSKPRVVTRTLQGGWMQYESGVWSACAEILVRKLVKPPDRPVRGWEPPEVQINAAMTKVVKMVRDGHLGKLVFEEPGSKSTESRRPDRGAQHKAQARAGHQEQNRI